MDGMETRSGEAPPLPGPPAQGGREFPATDTFDGMETGTQAERATGGDSGDHALREEVNRLRERVASAERAAALRRAISGIDWFDAEDAYRELAARVVLCEDGTWRARAEQTSPLPGPPPQGGRENPVGEAHGKLAAPSPARLSSPQAPSPSPFEGEGNRARVSLEEAARELARRKPHWVRARVSGGTGAGGTGGAGGVPGIAGAAGNGGSAGGSAGAGRGGLGGPGAGAGASSALTYADLLRPENRELLQEFIHERREELERMRAAHFHLRV